MPTTTILIISLLFVCIVFLSLKINVNTSEERVKDPTKIIEAFLDSKWGLADIFFRVLIMYLTFPFQFYIGKEFFFILYDEIKQRGISKKIDDIKSHTT
jgi:ABC-type Fe3+ transport system permease subunit